MAKPGTLGTDQCPLFGVERCPLLEGSKFYGKINRGQVSRPLYRGCPLFGGSVIRGFTVTLKLIMRECLNRYYVRTKFCPNP